MVWINQTERQAHTIVRGYRYLDLASGKRCLLSLGAGQTQIALKVPKPGYRYLD